MQINQEEHEIQQEIERQSRKCLLEFENHKFEYQERKAKLYCMQHLKENIIKKPEDLELDIKENKNKIINLKNDLKAFEEEILQLSKEIYEREQKKKDFDSQIKNSQELAKKSEDQLTKQKENENFCVKRKEIIKETENLLSLFYQDLQKIKEIKEKRTEIESLKLDQCLQHFKNKKTRLEIKNKQEETNVLRDLVHIINLKTKLINYARQYILMDYGSLDNENFFITIQCMDCIFEVIISSSRIASINILSEVIDPKTAYVRDLSIEFNDISILLIHLRSLKK